MSGEPDGGLEGDEIGQLVREWASVEDGEAKAYRFLVKAGASRSECLKASDPIVIGENGGDVAKLTRIVRAAVQTGLTMGKPKVFVEVYQHSGSKHPIKVLPIEGDSTAMREIEEADDTVSPSSHAINSMANAMAMTQARLMKSNEALMAQLLGVAGNTMELFGEASSLTAELRVRTELGYQSAMTESLKALAPTLQQTVPALFHMYLAYSQGPSGESPSPDGRFRARCAGIQREVLLLVSWSKELDVAERLAADPNLRMEVRGRLGQMITAALAAFEQVAAEPPPPPQPAGEVS